MDPIRDIEIIGTELILADLQTVDGSLGKSERAAKSGKPEDIARYEALEEAARAAAKKGEPARSVRIDEPEQQKVLKSLGLITAKKCLYVMNVDEDDLEGTSPACLKVRELAKKEGSEVVPVCAKIESELSTMADGERQEMLEALGLKEPAAGCGGARGVHAAGAAELLHGRAEGNPGVDDSGGSDGAAGGGRDPHRL